MPGARHPGPRGRDPAARGRATSWPALSGGRLITIEGGGHIPNARDPVTVNLAIREFIRGLPGAVDDAPTPRGSTRRRRPGAAAARTAASRSPPTASASRGRRSGRVTPAIVLLPSAPIVHSRQWKGQIHFLSRSRPGRSRTTGAGNGRSDRSDRPGRLPRRPDRGGHRLRPGRDRHGSGRARRAVRATGCGGRSAWPPSGPDRVLGIVAFIGRRPRLAPPSPTTSSASAHVR